MTDSFYSAAYPLFVYGSLLKGFPHPMSEYLWARTTFLGELYLPGRLYDLGSYPGFVFDRSTDTRVYGQLALLAEPHAVRVWQQLDAYEGIHLDNPEYERTLLEHADPILKNKPAWVYLLHRSNPNDQLIEGGDFRTFGESSKMR